MRATEFLPELAAPSNDIPGAIKLCVSMGNLPLVYRRFSTPVNSNSLLIKVDAEQRPSMSTQTMARIQSAVFQNLGITNPTFTTLRTPQKVVTGPNLAYIFIPVGDITPYYSSVVKDLGSARVKLSGMQDYSKLGAVSEPVKRFLINAAQVASTYVHAWPKTMTDHELIFDCATYYLLNLEAFFNQVAGNEFKGAINQNPHPLKGMFSKGASVPMFNPAVFNQLKTYNDVAKYLNNYASKSQAPARPQQSQVQPQATTPQTTTVAPLEEGSVEDLEKDLRHPYSYDAIDHMMKTIAKKYKITPKELHNLFVEKHGAVPDDWIKDAHK